MANLRTKSGANRTFIGRAPAVALLCVGCLLLLAADDPDEVETPPQAAERAVAPANAPAAKPVAGRLVRVPLPIAGNVDTQVRRAINKALEELPRGGARPVLVLEFAGTEGQTGRGSVYGRAWELARYLSDKDLSAVKTVAYIPGTLEGHAMLVAMACEEICMAPNAKFGNAGIDEPADEAIRHDVRTGYREIANRRRTVPAEVALAMLDKNLEVLKVETEVSPEFVLRSGLDELKQKHAVQSVVELNRPGQFAQFTGREARELGFVKYLAADRAALAKGLSLPPDALADDPSLLGEWRPVGIAIKGPITSQHVKRVERMIEDQRREHDINFVCLRIDSPGGSPIESMNLVNALTELDPAQVRTVAYVAREARGDAALIALACDQLVIGPDAELGGGGAVDLSDDTIESISDMLKERLGQKRHRSWSLAAAMIDPELKVYRYTHQPDGLVAFFSERELATQADPDKWTRGEEITQRGTALKVNGDKAVSLGLARATVKDMAGVQREYGLESDLKMAEIGWADTLIDALADPYMALLFLVIGGVALYIELQVPGVGLGGFVAGVCFLLFFWSSFLHGTAGWLEVLLFVAGLCCILIELFVVPGSAVFGLGGGLMVIASLVLASQTFVIPHNEYQLEQLRDSLLGVFSAVAAMVLIMVILRRYLPSSPFFRHVILQPPSNAELAMLEHREALVDWDHLLGEHGTTLTQLTPSGKARFGNEAVDVIADGELIERGSDIVVVAVHGNRVVVRSVNG